MASPITLKLLPSGIAHVFLNKPPVNTMSHSFWKALDDTLTTIHTNKAVRGIVFSSALTKNVFTAGNDLNELYAPNTSEEKYQAFWRDSNQTLARIYSSPLVTVAAVKGACPAGGTCLAMACDYRVLTKDASMGLNEVAIGISVPAMWIKLMSSIIGPGKAEKLCGFARSVKSEEALQLGLSDAVVENEAALLPHAESVLEKLLKLPDPGRRLTKKIIRTPLTDEWMNEARLKEEGVMAWNQLSDPKLVKYLDGVMKALSAPKAKI